MAAAFTLLPTAQNNIDSTMNEFFVEGTIALTANYGGGSTHGDTLNLSGIVPSNQLPIQVDIWEAPAAGTAPTGYMFGYAPGTTQANGVLTIINNITEYTQGSAYSAGLLAAVLRCRVRFPKFV